MIFRALVLCTLILVFNVEAQEEVSLNWEKREPSGSYVKMEPQPQEYTLTTESSSYGQIKYSGICALSYRLEFEIYFGTKTDINDGGSITFYETAEDMSYLHNEVNFDTFKSTYFPDASTNPDDKLDPEWEPNDHHISLLSNDGVKDRFGNEGDNKRQYMWQAGVQNVPFSMKGSGWSKVFIENNEGDFTVGFINHVAGTVLRSANGTVVRGKRTTFKLAASNKSKYSSDWNDHRVRNTKLFITKADDCAADSYLSHDDAVQELQASCGDLLSCDESIILTQECVATELDSLYTSGSITSKVIESTLRLMSDYQLYCDGIGSYDSTVPYSEGFTAGVVSIDVASAKEQAFSDGKSSIDVEGITKLAKEVGFNSGVASVDTESISTAAFSAGVESVDTESVRQSGFASGVESVDIETVRQSGFDAGFQDGKNSVICEDDTDNDEENTTPGKDTESSPRKPKKTYICHKGNSIIVSIEAAEAHLNHGDVLGKCIPNTPKKSKEKTKRQRSEKKKNKKKNSKR